METILTKTIFDAATGEIIVEELTEEEVAEVQAKVAEFTKLEKAKVSARKSALAKLAELGLTEQEIAAL